MLKRNKKKNNGHAPVDATSSNDSEMSRRFEKSDTHSVTSTPDIETKTHVATLRKAFSDPKTSPAGVRSGQDFLRVRDRAWGIA